MINHDLTQMEQYNHQMIVEHNATLVSDKPMDYPKESRPYSYHAFIESREREKSHEDFTGTPHQHAHKVIDRNYLNNPDF